MIDIFIIFFFYIDIFIIFCLLQGRITTYFVLAVQLLIAQNFVLGVS